MTWRDSQRPYIEAQRAAFALVLGFPALGEIVTNIGFLPVPLLFSYTCIPLLLQNSVSVRCNSLSNFVKSVSDATACPVVFQLQSPEKMDKMFPSAYNLLSQPLS